MNYINIKIIPEFFSDKLINNIRLKYDPLYKIEKPNINILYKTKTILSTSELSNKLTSLLKNITPFKLLLSGVNKISNGNDNLIVLNTVLGDKEIINIHKILNNFFNPSYEESTFIPFMVLGRLKTNKELSIAYNQLKDNADLFTTIINKLSIEFCDSNNKIISTFEHTLKS